MCLRIPLVMRSAAMHFKTKSNQGYGVWHPGASHQKPFSFTVYHLSNHFFLSTSWIAVYRNVIHFFTHMKKKKILQTHVCTLKVWPHFLASVLCCVYLKRVSFFSSPHYPLILFYGLFSMELYSFFSVFNL